MTIVPPFCGYNYHPRLIRTMYQVGRPLRQLRLTLNQQPITLGELCSELAQFGVISLSYFPSAVCIIRLKVRPDFLEPVWHECRRHYYQVWSGCRLQLSCWSTVDTWAQDSKFVSRRTFRIFRLGCCRGSLRQMHVKRLCSTRPYDFSVCNLEDAIETDQPKQLYRLIAMLVLYLIVRGAVRYLSQPHVVCIIPPPLVHLHLKHNEDAKCLIEE